MTNEIKKNPRKKALFLWLVPEARTIQGAWWRTDDNMCLRWSWLTTCSITIVTSSANFTVFSCSAVLTVNTFPGLGITRGRVVITNTWLTRWKSPVLRRAKVTLTTVGLDSAGALATQLVTQIIWWTGLVAITSSKKKKKKRKRFNFIGQYSKNTANNIFHRPILGCLTRCHRL